LINLFVHQFGKFIAS